MHSALTTSSRTADFRRPTLGLVNYRDDALFLGLGEARWPEPETQHCLFKK